MQADVPPLRGSANDMTADPTARNAFSNQFNGMWPLYAGVVLTRRVEIMVFLDVCGLDAEVETA